MEGIRLPPSLSVLSPPDSPPPSPLVSLTPGYSANTASLGMTSPAIIDIDV